MYGSGQHGEPAELVCHCLLLELGGELALVDTGFGLEDVHYPRPRLSRFFLGMNRPRLREEMTAVRQVERLGLRPKDVRHIVLTHLDFDHAGGLDDFPQARVHLLGEEARAAQALATWLDRQRYRPQQWSSRPRWVLYEPVQGERWFGFDCVRSLRGLPPEVLLVPLVGHTLGHAGVAVRLERGWLLHAGDAYFFHEEMDAEHPWCTPGLRLYQDLMQKDGKQRRYNQERLRELVRLHSDEVQVFCAHDSLEFEQLARASPAPQLRVLKGEEARGVEEQPPAPQ
jgi:glyoxylase-like metal-dependent hydrolase (beta-lactamase superfamily II)